MKKKRRKRDRFFGETVLEFVFELLWNILMYIPRLIIRLIGNIW